MSFKNLLPIALAALALTFQLAAQNKPNTNYHQYTLTEIGTFGGPSSTYGTLPGFSIEKAVNHAGATVGLADLNLSDPFNNCWFDCFVGHAITFQNGTLTDLGALGASTNSSFSYHINDLGIAVGVSENGALDPMTGYPEYHAVVWKNGQTIDLGTLGGAVSQAFAANEFEQVVGVAANSIPDQYTNDIGPCTPWNCWTVTTQQRAFLWKGGQLQDLGTLGTGTDAVALFINGRGQVAGMSFTNTVPNPTTGFPTQDGFLWDKGNMIDLGTLGGTVSQVFRLNNRGQVVGRSNLAGDRVRHGFFWDRGVLTDLGTLGGPNSVAFAVSDSGVVAGTAGTPVPNMPHAFTWKNGTITDLGTVAGDGASGAQDVNSAGTVVGESCDTGSCDVSRAFVWENGGPMMDLNKLLTTPTDLYLIYAYSVGDNGEIVAQGILPNGDLRIAVLKPHGECDSICAQRIASATQVPSFVSRYGSTKFFKDSKTGGRDGLEMSPAARPARANSADSR